MLDILERIPRNHTQFGVASEIIRTADGMALVGAGNIVPTSASIKLPSDAPRFFVIWRFLTPDYFRTIGEKFVVADLVLNEKARHADQGFLLRNGFGDEIGVVTWRDRRPGDLALTSVLPKTYAMLGLLLAVLAALGALGWTQMRAQSRRQAQAEHDAHHDALTGLRNRKALNRDLARLLASPAPGHQVAALFVDLDGFKEVNDTYNHDIGDRLISAVAVGLAALARDGWTVYRQGGDEFVFVLNTTGAPGDARRCAASVLALLDMAIDLDGRAVHIGASIGIALADEQMVAAAELMRRADVAMYAAKSAGKNRFACYDPAMDGGREEQAQVLAEVRRILERGELEVAYQPIVDARSLAVVGVEALARWPASSPLTVAPERFIAVAESAGLVERLGDFILSRACRDAVQWPGVRLSVNISPLQLKNPNFVNRVLALSTAAGLPPQRLELEVTEGTLLEDTRRLAPLFAQLQKAGVSVALDDFGAGYSSIAYLRSLTFNRIKIDRSLTAALAASEAARYMVQATGLIARGVGARVTAEGVEEEGMIALLRLAGCDEMQGFYFGRPMSAGDFTRSLDSAGQPLRNA